MWLAQLTQRGNYTWSLIPRPSILIQLYSSPESFQVVPCCLATQDLSGYTCTVAGMLSCDPGEHLVRLPQLINCFIKSTHTTKTVTKSKCLSSWLDSSLLAVDLGEVTWFTSWHQGMVEERTVTTLPSHTCGRKKDIAVRTWECSKVFRRWSAIIILVVLQTQRESHGFWCLKVSDW